MQDEVEYSPCIALMSRDLGSTTGSVDRNYKGGRKVGERQEKAEIENVVDKTQFSPSGRLPSSSSSTRPNSWSSSFSPTITNGMARALGSGLVKPVPMKAWTAEDELRFSAELLGKIEIDVLIWCAISNSADGKLTVQEIANFIR
jgi:hypothetical protein